MALVHTETGRKFATTTTAEGIYVFELLPPGEYSARGEFQGMSPQMSPPLHVEVGGVLEVNFQLPVAGARESMTVSSSPLQVETQPSAVHSLRRPADGIGRLINSVTLLVPQ